MGSMYIDMLRAVEVEVRGETTSVDGGGVIDVRRRSESAVRGGGDLGASLAAQVRYDVELMGLCRQLGIPCGAGRFESPGAERARLESALRMAGVWVGSPRGRVDAD